MKKEYKLKCIKIDKILYNIMCNIMEGGWECAKIRS